MSDTVAKTVAKRGTSGKLIVPRERLDLAEKLFLSGKSRPHIARRLCRKYGVSTRTAQRYIARIEARLAALPKPPPEAAFARAESMLLDAYGLARRAVKVVTFVDGMAKKSQVMPAPETGTMVAAAWRLAELHGVTAAQKVDVTSGGEKVALTIYAPPEQEP